LIYETELRDVDRRCGLQVGPKWDSPIQRMTNMLMVKGKQGENELERFQPLRMCLRL